MEFFAMQTPEEAVVFVGSLKKGNMSRAGAYELLREVGLVDPELYTRPIGGELEGGLKIRGLSGGERKRLALACALAMQIDEITSGLDSDSALLTMKLVRTLCIDRAVGAIVVIHQPDGYVFGCFTRLLLLSREHCIFSGHVGGLGDLYERRFGCTITTSIHEVPLDLLHRLNRIPDDELATEDPAKSHLETPVPTNASSELDEEQTTVPVGFLQKLNIVFHRNLLNHYVRNVTNLGARLLIYSACSVIDGA